MNVVMRAAALVGWTFAATSSVLAAPAKAASATDVEQADWTALSGSSPAVFALCQQAEAAFKSGALPEASALYGRARAAAPKNVVPARGACRVALARQQEADARLTCQRAFMLGGTPRDMRNTVAAMMGVTTKPAMSELVTASLLADGAVGSGPGEPWGYLARCDIARRVGDRRALDACLTDLRRVAPDHEETRRLLALSIAPASPWAWLGRGLLALALAASLVHALRSRWNRRGRARGGSLPMSGTAVAALVVVGFVALAALAGPAGAVPTANLERLSNYPVDDRHPEASIPSVEQQNKDPIEFGYLLQDMLAKAQAATKRGDHAAAARYYHALSIAVPSRSYAFSKACESYEAVGDRPAALAACRDALSREGVTIGDYSHFVVLTLARKEAPSAVEIKELGEVIDHLAKEPEGRVVADRLRCDVALRLHDVRTLELCSAALVKAAPEDPKTISFQWALALERHDHAQARAMIDRARKAGMAKDGLAKMEAATIRETRTRLLQLVLLGLGAVVIGSLVVVASRRFAAARRRSVPA